MKRIALLLSLLLLAACDEHKVTLAFNTQNSSGETFSFESKLRVLADDQNSLPEKDTSKKNLTPEAMNARLSVVLSSKLIDSYDDGTGRFLMNVDSVDYSSDNRSVEEFEHIEHYLKAQTFQFKMAPDGQMSALKMEDLAAIPDAGDLDIRRNFMKIQPVLPSSPVKIGDTWERQQLVDGDSGKRLFVYKWFKIDDIFVRGGVRLAKIQMNVKYKPHDADDAGSLTSDDFVLGSGYILFNVDAGMIQEGLLEVDGKMCAVENKGAEVLPRLRVHQSLSIRRIK